VNPPTDETHDGLGGESVKDPGGTHQPSGGHQSRDRTVLAISSLCSIMILVGSLALPWRNTQGTLIPLGDYLWQMGLPVEITLMIVSAFAILIFGWSATKRFSGALGLTAAGAFVSLVAVNIRESRAATILIGDSWHIHPGFLLACVGGVIALTTGVVMSVEQWGR
jgi:hypothetical protein